MIRVALQLHQQVVGHTCIGIPRVLGSNWLIQPRTDFFPFQTIVLGKINDFQEENCSKGLTEIERYKKEPKEKDSHTYDCKMQQLEVHKVIIEPPG